MIKRHWCSGSGQRKARQLAVEPFQVNKFYEHLLRGRGQHCREIHGIVAVALAVTGCRTWSEFKNYVKSLHTLPESSRFHVWIAPKALYSDSRSCALFPVESITLQQLKKCFNTTAAWDSFHKQLTIHLSQSNDSQQMRWFFPRSASQSFSVYGVRHPAYDDTYRVNVNVSLDSCANLSVVCKAN